ncbi:hypothetical protein GCM10028805_40840 [Spirosoma harenae]
MKERIDLQVTLYGLRFRLSLRRLAIFCVVFLFLLVGGQQRAQAQEKPASTSAIVTRDDRAPIRVRYPESDHLKDLQTDHDYQYGTDAPPPENPIARFFDWLLTELFKFLNSKSYRNIWQYVILAAVAGLVIYLLMKAEVLGFLFPKKAQSGGLDYENLAENIHEIDFDAAVEDAILHRNFRLAVRLRYLQTLKILADSEKIQYKPDKTNWQYVNELVRSPLQTEFEALTRQFEFVWYGDFPVDEHRFSTLQNQFRQFNGTVLSKAGNYIPKP